MSTVSGLCTQADPSRVWGRLHLAGEVRGFADPRISARRTAVPPLVLFRRRGWLWR